MIAREIFSDYSLGADQLGTPNGKVAPYFLQVTTPHFWQAKTPHFLHRTFFVSHAFLCKFVKKILLPTKLSSFVNIIFASGVLFMLNINNTTKQNTIQLKRVVKKKFHDPMFIPLPSIIVPTFARGGEASVR